jgi:hypothetical protein
MPIANTSEADICTRLFDIHKTEPRITASRYWPTDLSRLRLPVVVAVPSQAVYQKPSTTQIEIARIFAIHACAGDWNQGMPTESAQRNAEDLFVVMRDLYGFARLRLELDHHALEGVIKAELKTDVGLVDRSGKATLIFNLEVTYRCSK